MNSNKLPTTDSIQELAEFWNTHDVTDFEDKLEEVSEPVFDRRATFQVCLPDEEARQVEEIARSKGLPSEQLIRQWIIERIHSP